MKIGMLIYDNDPDSNLEKKVSKAIKYFGEKYGRKPTVCFVHPKMLKEEQILTLKIKILPNRFIAPGHLWIGINSNSTSYCNSKMI
jgi:hypothetical protein